MIAQQSASIPPPASLPTGHANLIAPSPADHEAFKQLCFHNGLSTGKHPTSKLTTQNGTGIVSGITPSVRPMKDVKSLEMCFYNFPEIRAMQMFPHLTTLFIIGQDIDKIEGLECCPLLEQLSICECRLVRIEGLERLTQLKQLHLYANQIERIEGLSTLERLERLWLFDNQIGDIENLDNCRELRDLNLAHNEISTIKSEALQSLVKLETLNLSGNLGLARLSDVLALRGLRSLATLRFQDPSFHSAPLSELENYQTYCIHHLPSLKQLDALKILPAIRTSVEAALIKKNMFYSMRRETIRYNQQMICDVIERVFKDRIQPLLDEIPVRGRGDESNGLLMQARRWDRVKQKLVHFVNRYAESRQKMLRAELHSCGFQNFQVERVGDVSADIDWAVDGVGSDKEVYGISYRVIANRKTADEQNTLAFLYGSNVEEAFHAIESCVNVHRESQDYQPDSLQLVVKVLSANPTVSVGLVLFCVTNSDCIKFIAEFVFDKADIGKENAFRQFETALTEFIKTTDENIHKLTDDNKDFKPATKNTSAFTSDLSWMKLDSWSPVSQSSQLTHINLSHNHLTAVDSTLLSLPSLKDLDLSFNKIESVKKNAGDSMPTQPSKILRLNLSGNKIKRPTDVEIVFELPQLKELDIRFNPISTTNFRLGTHLKHLERFNGEVIITKSAAENSIQPKAALIFDVKKSIAAWPQLNQKQMNLAASCIRELPILSGFKSITELDLSNNSLTSTCSLSGLTNLRWLNLAFNQLELMDLTFERLHYLNLSGNKINQVDLSGLPNLFELYMTGNNVKTLANVHHTKKSEKLVILNFENNPVTELPDYRHYILFICAKLQYLDSVFVTNEARHAAQEKFSGLFTFEFLLDVFPESHLHLLEEIRLAHMQINTVTCFNRRHYFEQLVSVDLSNNLLKEFNALLYLPALKCLSLESNRLQSLFSQPVHSYEWPALEQLYLGFNLITNVQSLQLEKFPNLQILSLNGNIIQQVSALPLMKKLTKFAIEANQIRVLDDNFFTQLPNLEELYLENNRLRNLTFWAHPKLKVLNICNNRLNDIMEIKKLDLPGLESISIKGNVMNRDKWHRYYLILQFGSIVEINEERVTENEKSRSEAYRFKFFNDDQSISVTVDSQPLIDHEVLAITNQAAPIVKINSLTLNLG